MKTTIKKIPADFDAVKSIRNIKEDISKDIVNLNFEQLKAYLEKGKLQSSK